jgi:hypothetical protein
MNSALPLAYASRHIYGDSNPYRPSRAAKGQVVESRRRRRRLPSLLRRPQRTQRPLSSEPATGR